MIAKNKKTKKDSNFQTIFFSLLIGIFLLGSVGFLIISNFKINQKRGELTNKIESLKKEVQALEKNRQLQAGISQTESESYWEEKAREQGYKKPGEEAVVVLPPEEKSQSSNEKEKSFFEKILEKIGFGRD